MAKVYYCDAKKILLGVKEEECHPCAHHACPYFQSVFDEDERRAEDYDDDDSTDDD